MNIKKHTAILCVMCMVIVTMSACARDVANRYFSPNKYPPKPVDAVYILKHKPTVPFEVIAEFQSRGETELDIQRKAADVGADAVILQHLGGLYSRSDEWAGEDTQRDTYSRIVGIAIKYTGEKP